MRTALVITGILALSATGTYTVSAQDAPKPAAGPSCEAQLAQAHTENATVVQLWRDIQQSRGAYEIQVASVRVALGGNCVPDKPVSVCVAELVARLNKPPAKPAATEPKK